MTTRFRPLAAAAISAIAFCAPGLWAQQPAPSDTTEEIKALRQRLDQLELQQKQAEQQHQATERKLEEKITGEKLSSDAATHDQFITAEGFTAGYAENRFVIQSNDGNFVLRPWFHLQIRGVANDRDNVQGNKIEGPEDETNVGFEIRRLRFGFDGTMFSPDFSYFFNWTTSRTASNATVSGATPATKGGTVTVSNNLGGVPILEEAWARYHIPTSPFYIRVGQMHDPLLHEEMTSSRYRHSAEISLTGDIFANGDAFTEAATVIFDPSSSDPTSAVRAEAGVNHGLRSANTNFESYPNNGSFNAFNYGFAGRVEYKVMGRWKDYGQVAAIDVTEPLLVIGLGGDYSERGHDGQLVTALDGMYADQNGLMVYSSLVDRYTTHNFGYYTQSAAGASITDPNNPQYQNKATNEYSVLIEAGYLINQHLEPFGRYEYIKLAGTAAGTRPWVQDITAGVNYYFQGHRLKLTAEIIWLPNGIPFDDTPNDILANTNGHTEIVGEFQLQLLL